MLELLIGVVLFAGGHTVMAVARPWRSAIIGRLGELGYKALYSVVAIIGLVLIVRGWSAAPVQPVYSLPLWMRSVAYGLMWPAIVLLVASYLPAGQIAARARHPMVLGVKIWAFAHLLANGEVRSLIVFGALLAFAVIDRIALKKRQAPGRRAGSMANDGLAIGLGTVAYVAIFTWLHPYVAGVALV